MIRVVTDTNGMGNSHILLQGLTRKGLAGQIIDAWADRVFLPCFSAALALEYEEILTCHFPKNRYPHIEPDLQALLDRAEFVPVYFRYRGSILKIQEESVR